MTVVVVHLTQAYSSQLYGRLGSESFEQKGGLLNPLRSRTSLRSGPLHVIAMHPIQRIKLIDQGFALCLELSS